MENTYVVYAEEYYFSLMALSTILKKRIYNISYDKESAEEVKDMMEEVLKKLCESSEINANKEILTTYSIKTICLEGKLSFKEARETVINDDYTWGKVGKSK